MSLLGYVLCRSSGTGSVCKNCCFGRCYIYTLGLDATGGGCGAHGQNYAPGQNANSTGKAGGSGIVIVAYPLTQSGGEIQIS